MRLDTMTTTTTVVILATFMVTLCTGEDDSSTDRRHEENEASAGTPREKRDGYGGMGSYSSAGGYGCNCPYQNCDANSDLLLYFSAGALLGLLFSLLQGGMMMMPPPPPPPAPMTGGRNADHLLDTLPTLLATDIAPLATDIMKVYTRSEKHPECVRRWVCELTQKSLKQGGLRARITSVSSVALSWLLKDMMPFLENMDSADHFDCSILAHECKQPFDQPPVTYN